MLPSAPATQYPSWFFCALQALGADPYGDEINALSRQLLAVAVKLDQDVRKDGKQRSHGR